MTLCALLVSDFMNGTGRHDETGRELYDDEDLCFGAAYAANRLAMGYQFDPVDGFNLAAFGSWCSSSKPEGSAG